MNPRFTTPILKRREAPAPPVNGQTLDAWSTPASVPWKDAVAERRLSRVAFYFAEAQRAPGRRLGKHLLRVLALLRVRLGFFSFDFERAAVDFSALVRTGRPRPMAGE
jgi:hypothetical protein